MIRLTSLVAPAIVAGIVASVSAIHADPASAPVMTAAPQTATDTMAEMNTCGARNDIIKELSAQFQEAPQAIGQVDQSAVLEVFVSEAGTWTILATGTDGNSCILSAGEGWQSRDVVAGHSA